MRAAHGGRYNVDQIPVHGHFILVPGEDIIDIVQELLSQDSHSLHGCVIIGTLARKDQEHVQSVVRYL